MSTSSNGPGGRRWLRVKRVLLATVATVVALEVILQAGAFIVWFAESRPVPEIPAGHDVVLCVGDSWTHGMGSSDPRTRSYPAVLQQLVRQASKRDWTVINGGQGGQHSRDVLQRLPSQLEHFRPKIVCVLVGQNDFWAAPEELAQGDDIDHSAYRFRWRVPRLLAWTWASLSEPAPAPAAARGPEWEPRGPKPARPYADEPRKWNPSALAREHAARGRQLARGGDVLGAIAAYELALGECPGDAAARAALAELYRKNGQHDEASRELDWLTASWEQDRDYRTGRQLALALAACDRDRRVLELVPELLSTYPLDTSLIVAMARSQFLVGEVEEALRSVDTAIAIAPEPGFFWLRYRLCMAGLGRPDKAVASALAAYVLFNNAEQTATLLRSACKHVGAAKLRAIVESLESYPCPPDVRERLLQIVDEVVRESGADDVSRVLAAHLTRIATTARNAGATPVFLTYPTAGSAGRVLRRVAEQLDAELIDVAARFAELLGDRDYAEVRSADGHVDDEGYRLMATAVADGLGGLLAR